LRSLDLVVIGITSLAVFFDLKERRIPNWLILFCFSAGVIINIDRGIAYFVQSIVGFAAGIVVLLVPFFFGWIGAGDVKYFAAIGAILGIELLPRVLFYSAVVGGIWAVVAVLVGRVKGGFVRMAWNDCKLAILTGGRVLPEPVSVRVARGAPSLPWGVALAAGTILAHFIDREGAWAGF
jgi:prepilin peptidase CpaA